MLDTFVCRFLYLCWNLTEMRKRVTAERTLIAPVRLSQAPQYPRTMMYGFFARQRIDPPHRPCSSGVPTRSSCLRPPPSPTHSSRRVRGHGAFATLQVLFSGPTTGRASRPISLPLIGLLTPAPAGDPASPPEVTPCSSVPCRPHTPWSEGRMDTAFVAIVPTRPGPPLWPTGSSLGQPPSITARYFSASPSDSTPRWTPCPPQSH
jgi:hypothetical protein